MSRFILIVLLLGLAYYAGTKGLTHKDALIWLEDNGFTEKAQVGVDTASEWLNEKGVSTERVTKQVKDTLDQLKPQ